MATEAADIGANFSNYQGNAGLAGGNFGVVELNTKPLENLAAFTMLRNKELWKQQQYETDLKVKELADLSKISLNSLRGKDKEQATKEFATLIKDAGEYARKIPKTPQERMENELKWQTQLGGFMNNYGSGKQRAVSYQAQRSAIESESSDASTKEEKLRQLDEVFDKTGIDTPISAVPNFKTENLEIPKPIVGEFNSVIIEPNRNIAGNGTYFDPSVNIGMSDAAVLGISTLYPQKGTEAYNKLSPKEKDQARIQATIPSKSKVAADAAAILNPILAQYVNEKGIFDETSFENDNASDKTLMAAYNGLKKLNDYSRDKFENGAIYDSKGLSVKLPTSFNKNNFKAGFVDFSKPIKPNQLVLSGSFAEYTGDKFKAVVTETENARQDAQLAEIIRNNKADQYLKGKELKMNEDKWKASQTGGQTQVNGAMERAKRIYGEMLELADANGVISPDQIRKLNIEQLKYLGIEAPQERDAAGNIISSGGFKPLSFTEKDKKGNDVQVPHVIQMVDGQIRVLKNAKKDPATGYYIGEFDNTKSTTLNNMGTNILNEELKNSGSKELNAYMGVDVTGGVTSNTDGGSTTTSGSTQTQQNSTVPKKITSKGLPIF